MPHAGEAIGTIAEVPSAHTTTVADPENRLDRLVVSGSRGGREFVT